MTNNRYIRHYTVPYFGKSGQEKLASKTVAVIGAGGLGSPVLMQLAGSGVGHIIIIEHDTVQESNLSRQLLYTVADIEQLKGEVAKERLHEINPDVRISPHNLRLTTDNALDLLSPADLVIDCCDNFSTRYLINDACVILQKPWVFGAIESWTGQYAVFNFPVNTGPTYRCIFPEVPDDAPDCNEIGVLPPLPSVIGSYMANAAIQVLAGIKADFQGKLSQIDLLKHTFHILKFKRNDEDVKSITALTNPEYSTLYCSVPDPHIEITWDEYSSNKDAFHPIDIRDEFEYELNPFPGENIPYYTLLADPKLLNEFTGTILLVCDSGKRSLELAKKISAGRVTAVKSLSGGINKRIP